MAGGRCRRAGARGRARRPGADSRVAGVEQAVYVDSADRVAIASSTGIAGELRELHLLRLPAGAGGEWRAGGRPASASASRRGPAGLDPAAIGREGAERAAAMIGAGKPASRSCPVVLDPTVAASFVGLIGGALGAGAVQRGRSPFAERLGDEVASEALRPARRRPRSRWPGLGALRRRGRSPPPHRADRGRRVAGISSTTPTPPVAASAGSTGNAGRSGYRSQPSVSTSNLIVAPGALAFEELLRRGGRRGLRHRRRRASLRRQPGDRRLLGRRFGAGDRRRRARRAAARVHDRQRPGLDAARCSGGRRGRPLGPLRRLGQRRRRC